MEAFYASISGVLTTLGGLTAFYFLLRKDIKEGLQRAENDRRRIETGFQEALKEGLQRAEKDRLRIKADLEGDIQKVKIDLEGDINRVEDRLIKVDERGWKMEGDMKVVKHHLQITDAAPAAEPTRPRPARETTGQRQTPAAPVPSKT